jgi:tRNA pseudouridine55 synthase
MTLENFYMNLAGIIILDKPIDMSSAFATRLIRKRIGATKAGHLGTLDPFATGVLPIAIGCATKLIQYIKPKQKIYEFEITFGEKRNTADRTGQVVETSDFIPSMQDIISMLANYKGESIQFPNPFSAIKIDGERAYKIARRGDEVLMRPRKINIFSIDLTSQLSEKVYKLKASVSPGTYIRTIAEDIACKLSTVAYVSSLHRLADGKFSIENAIPIDRFNDVAYDVESVMCRLENILDDIPVVSVDLHCADDFLKGRPSPVVLGDYEGIIAASSSDGFFAIAEVVNCVAFPKKIIRLVY